MGTSAANRVTVPAPTTPLTWDGLVAIRPELADLLTRCRGVQAPRGQRLCSVAAWYGFSGYRGFKREVISLVGWETRCAEHREPIDPPVESGPVIDLFRQVPSAAAPAPCAACETLDPRIYSMEAYDLAYQTLYRAIPCADPARCRCQ